MPIVFECPLCSQKYRVADEKAGQRARCKHCGADMTVPRPPETTRGGSVVYRHTERQSEFTPAIGDSEHIEAISDHIEKHLGPIESVWHEIVSDLVHIDVHQVPPTEERPYYSLVTSGMSDRPMTVPDAELDSLRYAELMISLPSNWRLEKNAFDDETNYWPIRLLKSLARLPHEYNTWLAYGHTIPNGDPPERYAPDVPFVCALIAPPLSGGPEFATLELSDEISVNFYSVIPLYPEEMQHKLNKGTDSLLKRLDRSRVSDLLDLRRSNTCRKRFGWF
jgi:hypothetical protein